MNKYGIGSAVITLANAPDPEAYRPHWAPKDLDAGTMTRAMLELGYCMNENPPESFVFADVVEAVMTEMEDDEYDGAAYPEGMGDRVYVWEVTLKDGRRFHVEGWHDYTGWGCQDGAEYTEIVSEETK